MRNEELAELVKGLSKNLIEDQAVLSQVLNTVNELKKMMAGDDYGHPGMVFEGKQNRIDIEKNLNLIKLLQADKKTFLTIVKIGSGVGSLVIAAIIFIISYLDAHPDFMNN